MPRGRGRNYDREMIEEKRNPLNLNCDKICSKKRMKKERRKSDRQNESISNSIFLQSSVFEKDDTSIKSLDIHDISKNNFNLYELSYEHILENTLTEQPLININQKQTDNFNELEAISVLEGLSNSVSVTNSSYIKKSQNSNSDDDLSSLSELNESEAETERIEDVDSVLDIQIKNRKLIEDKKKFDTNGSESSQSSTSLHKEHKNRHDLFEAAELLSTSSNEYIISKKDSKSDVDDDSIQSKIIPSIDNESTADEEIVESIVEDDNVNMNVDDEVDEERIQKRKEAIAALTQIEIQFAKLRDKLYENQISYLDREVDLVNKGIHPELSSLIEKITERRERKYNIAVSLRDMLIKSINDEFIAHQYEIQNNFLESKRKLREKILLRTGEKCFQIYYERRLMETSLIPEYGFSVPNKRSVQLRHRRAHELEVTFLSGLKSYIGFPAAPEIKNASKDEIMRDLTEIRSKRIPSSTLRNLPSSNCAFQNIQPYNQECQLKSYNNNVFPQSSHQKSSKNRQYVNYSVVPYSSHDYSSTKQHSLDKYSLFNFNKNYTSLHDQYYPSFDIQHERASMNTPLMNNNKASSHFPLSPRLNQSLQYFQPLQKDNYIYWNDSSFVKNESLCTIKDTADINGVLNFRSNSQESNNRIFNNKIKMEIRNEYSDTYVDSRFT
ncbi:hypothetical protein PCK1_000229 [Pneumocystis canis]|nr:hypothetical protein PCK1_000229 [Pneumocystis canis]